MLALLITGLISSAGLSIALFLQHRRLMDCMTRLDAAESRSVEDLKLGTTRLEQFESRLEKLEQATDSRSDWISRLESVNLNRRGQVLRLHQKGHSVAEIASALRIGQAEVSFTIKVAEIPHGVRTEAEECQVRRPAALRQARSDRRDK